MSKRIVIIPLAHRAATDASARPIRAAWLHSMLARLPLDMQLGHRRQLVCSGAALAARTQNDQCGHKASFVIVSQHEQRGSSSGLRRTRS